MSDSRIERQLAPLPNQIMEFVPNRPPDFHFPPIGAESNRAWDELLSAQSSDQVTCAAVWLPTETEPGYAYTRVGTRPPYSLAFEISNHVTRLEEAKDFGMRDVLRAAGIETSQTQIGDVGHYELICYGPEQFARKVDAAVDAGLTHARFAVNSHPGAYDAEELTASIGKAGRILIAPLEENSNVDDYLFVLHDMLLHGAGHLGLAKEVVGSILLKGKVAYWAGKVGIRGPGRWLCTALELEVGLDNLQSCVGGGSEFTSFRYGSESAARLTRRHLSARLAAERLLESNSVSVST